MTAAFHPAPHDIFRAFSLAMLLLALAVAPAAAQTPPDATPYASPYGVRLPYPMAELIPDLLSGERGRPRHQAAIPHALWYSHHAVGPWGPLPRAYDPPSIAQGKGADWKRARILATGLRYLGYGYRHHHIPDWNPSPGWHTPRGKTPHAGKGVDCSNFSAFVYNQGLGIAFSSDIHKQAAATAVAENGAFWPKSVTVIPAQPSYEAWLAALKPGDLLFIRPRGKETISHVVIWVGPWSDPADGPPLVLDSHGADVRDANGILIPAGVHLRPFKPGSWYAVRAARAIRIIGD